jgi:6-phosphogluconate dehydrogenase (decarboxylating)
MIRNGIEYGLMQAYAEGFDVLKHAASANLPEAHRYALDLPDIAELWRRGSVVTSWLLDLTATALAADEELARYSGVVQDSGEGRWTVMAAVEEAVPADVLSAALYARFRSRQEHTFAEKILSAMRKGFGGISRRNSSSAFSTKKRDRRDFLGARGVLAVTAAFDSAAGERPCLKMGRCRDTFRALSSRDP